MATETTEKIIEVEEVELTKEAEEEFSNGKGKCEQWDIQV